VKEYIKGAVALANDHARIARLRQEIRPLLAASPIRNAKQFSADIEALYRRMWHAWCEGEKLPSDI
jgi:protein O-GlcNAc transferase